LTHNTTIGEKAGTHTGGTSSGTKAAKTDQAIFTNTEGIPAMVQGQQHQHARVNLTFTNKKGAIYLIHILNILIVYQGNQIFHYYIEFTVQGQNKSVYQQTSVQSKSLPTQYQD
jgi:hypothetical protein